MNRLSLGGDWIASTATTRRSQWLHILHELDF